jgi:nondiscriminating glutamyl-tRNA synthetase
MSEPSLKTRFAPSPTGEMHLGNLRTALFNALLARGRQGTFLLRIEDTDVERSRAVHAEALMGELRWLGLVWDEGPYFQARRGDIYDQYYRELEARGLTYPCFCTSNQLALARRSQRAAGQPPRYPGTCAQLTAQEVRRRLDAGLRPTIRFRVPPGEPIDFDDLVRGRQRFLSDEIGDFIIRRSDGSAAFFFTNAIDDALMGITHVLRGEDHLANTPRQLLLLRALDLRAPVYGHLSLLVGEDGAPLSKRHGSRSLRQMRAEGYLPGALLNYLARLGHSCDTDTYLTFEELAAAFSVERLGRAPARFDEHQLRHWQKEAVAAATPEQLLDWFKASAQYAQLAPQPDDSLLTGLLAVVRDNVVMPRDVVAWLGRLAGDAIEPDAEGRAVLEAAGRGFFEHALDALDGAADFRSFASAAGRATGARGRALFMPLRVALTGVTHGPEMQRVWEWLGQERCRRRLQETFNRWGRGIEPDA